jgi:hypothetical protein
MLSCVCGYALPNVYMRFSSRNESFHRSPQDTIQLMSGDQEDQYALPGQHIQRFGKHSSLKLCTTRANSSGSTPLNVETFLQELLKYAQAHSDQYLTCKYQDLYSVHSIGNVCVCVCVCVYCTFRDCPYTITNSKR